MHGPSARNAPRVQSAPRSLSPLVLTFAALTLAGSAAAKGATPPRKKDVPTGPSAVISYKPTGEEGDRPVPVEVIVSTRGADYAMRLTFDKVPWGEDCKQRCANTTLFLDTDNDRSTGLQLGPEKLETGADLAITIQGAREYKEKSADVFLRAKVKHLREVTSLDKGETISELDHRRDVERLQSDGQQVLILVDASNMAIPAGKTLRVVYHPPADKALEASTRGMGGNEGSAQLFTKKGAKAAAKKKKR